MFYFRTIVYSHYSSRIIGILGGIPYKLMVSGRHVPSYFTQTWEIYKDPWCENNGSKWTTSDPQRTSTDKGRLLHLLYPKKTSLWHRLSLGSEDPFLTFIRAMLEIEPSKRLSAKELLQHEFLKIAYTWSQLYYKVDIL